MDRFAFSITLPHDPALLRMFRDLAAEVCRSAGATEAACGPACDALESLVAGRMTPALDGRAPLTVRFERRASEPGVAVEVSGPACPGDEQMAAGSGPVACETDGRQSRLRLLFAVRDRG